MAIETKSARSRSRFSRLSRLALCQCRDRESRSRHDWDKIEIPKVKFSFRKRTLIIKQSYISFFKVPKHLFWNNFKNSKLSDLSSYWLSKSSQYSAVVSLVFSTKVKEQKTKIQNWRKSWTKTPVSKKFYQNLIFCFAFWKSRPLNMSMEVDQDAEMPSSSSSSRGEKKRCLSTFFNHLF